MSELRARWWVVIWLASQFAFYTDPASNVAWMAHVGGFATGAPIALLAVMVGRRRAGHRRRLPRAPEHEEFWGEHY